MIFYLYQVITSLDLVENKLHLQQVLHGIPSDTNYVYPQKALKYYSWNLSFLLIMTSSKTK